uniref:Uncharacterized protein n=1 Tax=Ralstonia solanacearum TaxID=305 RepID=A0A0S4UCI9_RALSL|nr:conserved protein of unknown function [Ralstonia solanacearum]CUV27363.1 conserved protein of unknown function [Ralstonia solanacearum]CUV34636.1 conserved protein of unknown function [Ralstonia solanacearum]CUV41993.1 conserved protein of unknown function [Ralstonia solanacearum]CUV46082.1 conserved protein of unknown function [Ralstonia solanacearum]
MPSFWLLERVPRAAPVEAVPAARVDPDAASLVGVMAGELLTWLIFTGVSEERVHPNTHIGRLRRKL